MKKLYAVLLLLALLLPVLSGCRLLPSATPTSPAGDQTVPSAEQILPSDTPAMSQLPTEAAKLTHEEARDLALQHAGFTVDQVRQLEVELDRDDGTVHYDVDFEKDGYDYEYEINAANGNILKSQKERD